LVLVLVSTLRDMAYSDTTRPNSTCGGQAKHGGTSRML
jgi:hypothetical protein